MSTAPFVSPYLTAAEAAIYLRYRGSSGIRMAVARGRLVARGRGPRGMLLFLREDLDAFISGRGSASIEGRCQPARDGSRSRDDHR